MAVGGDEAFKKYLSLNKELEFHNRLLVEKPQIIVANKMDLEKSKDNFSDFTSRIGKDAYPPTKNFSREMYPISALTGQGVDKLIEVSCPVIQILCCQKNLSADNLFQPEKGIINLH